jgi:hypothetical protein
VDLPQLVGLALMTGKLTPILISYSFVWELRAGSFSEATMAVYLCFGGMAP